VREEVEKRLADLARRAGVIGLPPAAVAAAAVVLAVAVVLAMWRWWPRAGVEVVSAGARDAAGVSRTVVASETLPGSAASGEGVGAAATSVRGLVVVHVVGAVLRPGVYELPANARVCDAIGAAGGLTGNAAQRAVNQARPVTDGEQIAVPTEDEYSEAAKGAAMAGSRAAGGSQSANLGAPGPSTQVDINTADAAALDALPGVGPSTAARIIADREANGPFASPDDLGRVSGIGPKKLEQLKGCIRVR